MATCSAPYMDTGIFTSTFVNRIRISSLSEQNHSHELKLIVQEIRPLESNLDSLVRLVWVFASLDSLARCPKGEELAVCYHPDISKRRRCFCHCPYNPTSVVREDKLPAQQKVVDDSHPFTQQHRCRLEAP